MCVCVRVFGPDISAAGDDAISSSGGETAGLEAESSRQEVQRIMSMFACVHISCKHTRTHASTCKHTHSNASMWVQATRPSPWTRCAACTRGAATTAAWAPVACQLCASTASSPRCMQCCSACLHLRCGLFASNVLSLASGVWVVAVEQIMEVVIMEHRSMSLCSTGRPGRRPCQPK